MPRRWNQSDAQASPLTSVVQLHLRSCTHQGSERGLVQRRVTFQRHGYLCSGEPKLKVRLALVVGIVCPRGHLRVSSRFVLFSGETLLVANCSEPDSRRNSSGAWRQHVSTLRLSLLQRWQQSTDLHFLPGKRWQLFEKSVPIERCNSAPPWPALSRGQRAPPCGNVHVNATLIEILLGNSFFLIPI